MGKGFSTEFNIGDRRVVVKDDTLRILTATGEERYDLKKVTMIGAKRKFSRLLLVLAITSAALVIIDSGNLLYLTFAAIIFLSTIIFREEGIVLVFDKDAVVLSPLDRKVKGELLPYFEGFLGEGRTRA